MTVPTSLSHGGAHDAPDGVQAAEQPKVLCVDDELSVLDGIERVLRSRFDVTKVANAADAMVALQYGGPFAVIISDLRLAETNGLDVLARVRAAAPDTVRLLLTGHADADNAIAAINDGHVFAFVRKPCRPEVLRQYVADAVHQHRLLVAERELLERTLRGAIKALTDLLALSSPIAAARAARLTRYACDLCVDLRIERWEVEIAAMVSHVGCATLAPELAERICRGDVLNAAERELADRLPSIAENVLEAIPRLEGVRAILRHSRDRFDGRHPLGGMVTSDGPIPVGARILHVVADFDTLDCRGVPVHEAVAQLADTRGLYDPAVLRALQSASKFFGVGMETHELLLSEVRLGMVFVTDVVSPAGILLIGRGQDATASLLERIRNHWASFAGRQRVRMVTRAGT